MEKKTSSCADQSPAELKESDNKQCEEASSSDSTARLSLTNLEAPKWVGKVQGFFKDKKESVVRDIFEPLRKKFKLFDRANNGVITKDEFLEALSTSGVDVKSTTMGEFDTLFESFDIAGNGAISISEFVTVLGAPLIQNPNATVDDIFRDTTNILLMKGNSKDVLNRQWVDICGRIGIDPQRGTLTFDNFKDMMERECDWCLTQEQLMPIFKYLDMNQNGKVSIITMRFMVSEMAEDRSKGRTLMVIDLLKQAMTNCQGEVIRKQAETIKRLNDELVIEHKTLKEIENNSPQKNVCYTSMAVGMPKYRRTMKVKKDQSIASAFFSWPLPAILSWVTIFILFILTFFAAHPEGDFGIDLIGVTIFGLVISIIGVFYNIMVWPVVRMQDSVSIAQVVCSMGFGVAAPIIFGLGVAFLNPFYYTDLDCFSCRACGSSDETVCYGDWEQIGAWQNTCPCALDDMKLWNNAWFALDSDYDNCNTTLYHSNYFEGDHQRLKPCMFYSNGMFMRLGFAMIIATVIVLGASCWGCFKDLHLWVKSVNREIIETQKSTEHELGAVDLYG